MQEVASAAAPVATVRARTSFLSQILTLIAVVVPPIGLLSAMGILWGVAFHVTDLILLVTLYTLTGSGITIGFHRLFSHQSFKSGPAVRGAFAILGSLAMQGPLTQWVTDHRKHHALSDREGDPHSPHVGREGFFGHAAGLVHAHMGWLFYLKGLERGPRYARDLYEDSLIRWIDRLYLLWVVLTVAIPFGIGYAVGGTTTAGLEAMVWGGILRIFLVQHMTWSVNSICHVFGSRGYFARDESRNNWLLAIPSFGEAWHNNHHAFPSSALSGLDRGQIDLGGYVIRGLERLGLVWDVKRPTPEQRARRRLPAAERA